MLLFIVCYHACGTMWEILHMLCYLFLITTCEPGIDILFRKDVSLPITGNMTANGLCNKDILNKEIECPTIGSASQ